MSEIKSNRAWREECESMRQQLASRDVEVAELKADAERYRWLRNGGDDGHGVGIYDSAIGDFCFTTWNEDLDYAIDSARSTK